MILLHFAVLTDDYIGTRTFSNNGRRSPLYIIYLKTASFIHLRVERTSVTVLNSAFCFLPIDPLCCAQQRTPAVAASAESFDNCHSSSLPAGSLALTAAPLAPFWDGCFTHLLNHKMPEKSSQHESKKLSHAFPAPFASLNEYPLVVIWDGIIK